MKKRNLKKKIIIWGSSFLALILAMIIAFIVYVNIYYGAKPEVDNYYKGSDTVKVVETGNYITFEPTNNKKQDKMYIFYPGAKVEEKAYSKLMYELAEEGVYASIVKVPFRIAFFNEDGAKDVMKDYSNMSEYYIGGHSLGGVVSTSYLNKERDKFKGVILLASYTTIDYSDTDLKFLSIYGENDKVLKIKNYDNANYKNIKPGNIYQHIIPGGNHAGFAQYGEQRGDGDLTITNQIEITRDDILNFMDVKKRTS